MVRKIGEKFFKKIVKFSFKFSQLRNTFSYHIDTIVENL